MNRPSLGRRRHAAAMTLVVFVVLALAGCSSGSQQGSTPDPTPDPAPDPVREVELEFCAADEPIDANDVASCIAVPVRIDDSR